MIPDDRCNWKAGMLRIGLNDCNLHNNAEASYQVSQAEPLDFN
jgi:hypothetical protein